MQALAPLGRDRGGGRRRPAREGGEKIRIFEGRVESIYMKHIWADRLIVRNGLNRASLISRVMSRLALGAELAVQAQPDTSDRVGTTIFLLGRVGLGSYFFRAGSGTVQWVQSI